ncbi:hypothetical protein FSP39_006693 [Pinctada imbricata]|uniref:PHD-type domain-containing protein n=1 Tax=Pinctada imbricata TaxID=66713 RepID=A0AA88XYB6_PINIB|nr:hypothetical protein FSP39_006693 [Pinctada imbricata]
MASASDGLCHNDPNFAVICNFLDRYGELLGFKDVSYADLQTWIEDTKHVSSFLSDIHIRLMRKMGKKITADKWEKYIMKFILDNYSEVDAWEIDRYGYKLSKVSTKLTLLKTLMERQFDLNKTFKEKINEKTPEELRYMPLGRDKNGLAYWYMLDKDLNLRVYREDLDDVNAETWELVCSNRQELATLIGQLADPVEGKTEDKDSNSEASGSVKNEPGAVKGEVSEDSQDSVLSKDVKTEIKTEGGSETQKNLSDTKHNVKKEPDKVGKDEVDGVGDKKAGPSQSIVKCEVKVEDIMKVQVKVEQNDNNEVQCKVKKGHLETQEKTDSCLTGEKESEDSQSVDRTKSEGASSELGDCESAAPGKDNDNSIPGKDNDNSKDCQVDSKEEKKEDVQDSSEKELCKDSHKEEKKSSESVGSTKSSEEKSDEKYDSSVKTTSCASHNEKTENVQNEDGAKSTPNLHDVKDSTSGEKASTTCEDEVGEQEDTPPNDLNVVENKSNSASETKKGKIDSEKDSVEDNKKNDKVSEIKMIPAQGNKDLEVEGSDTGNLTQKSDDKEVDKEQSAEQDCKGEENNERGPKISNDESCKNKEEKDTSKKEEKNSSDEGNVKKTENVSTEKKSEHLTTVKKSENVTNEGSSKSDVDQNNSSKYGSEEKDLESTEKTVNVKETKNKDVKECNNDSTSKKTPTKNTNKNKNSRKRGIQYDESSEDSVVEPENKKAKDGKKMLPKGKRKTPSKVEALSSDESDDVPLSQMSRGRTPNKQKSRKRVETDSSQSLVTPTRKSSRPSKKKKLHSDEEYEDEFLTIATSKSPSRPVKKLGTSDEGSPAPQGKIKKLCKNSKQKVLKSKDKNNKSKSSSKKLKNKSDEITPKKSKKSKSSKIVYSSDDEPLVKSAKKSKSKKVVESEEEKESEVDDGRRRSARVKSLRKQKKEPTPEFSSLEEDEVVESDFKLTSEAESDDSDDVDFSPKGRNALRQAARIKQEEQEEINNDTPCCKCLKYDRPEWLLLCDTCDAGYHTACLRPPLFVIPEGDWFCPPCEHKQLVSKLQDNLRELDVLLKKHDRLVKRKERLAFVGISLDNILKEVSRNRGKDMANIYEAEGREYHPSEEEEETGKPPPVVSRKKARKLTLLDSDDEPQDDDSEEFQLTDETCSEPPEEEEEDDDDEEISDFSEDGEGWRSCRRRSQYGRSSRRSSRRRPGAGRFKDFVVDDEYDSDDYRRSRRKAARKRVNYDEILADEDETELEEETEESIDSSDLCSDDSDHKKKHKKSKKKKKKKRKKEKRKKSKRRLKSEDESGESEKDNEDGSKSDDSSKSEVVKKAHKRRREKKKKKRRASPSDSDSESDIGKRRSRRFAQKVNYKALLGSESDEERKVSSKKKKKETSTESSESDTESESGEEQKPPTKKKGVILDETTGEAL